MEKRMYKIDFATNTVKITKAFEKQAQVFGSEAYTMLMGFRAAGFSIVNPAPPKHKSRPSYNEMRHYLTRCEDSEALVAEYDQIVDLYENAKGGYSKVYAWFHKECPCYDKTPEWNKEGKVIRIPAGHDANKLRKAS